ncbi:MAG: aminotransferase class I/II-fold pyridoxal phosphate-dependent enzyme [Thermoplasmata archaeon]
MVNRRTELIVLNTLSNPTGTVLRRRVLRAIADIAEDNDLFVLSDETYERLVFDVEHSSIARLRGMARRTITVSGFSNTYAMTGRLLGWMIAPARIIDAMGRLQKHTTACVPALIQKGGGCCTPGFSEILKGDDERSEKKQEDRGQGS